MKTLKYFPWLLALVTLAALAEKQHDWVIGIDLGTSTCAVGVYRHGKVEIMANSQGNRITPSFVAFTDNGERLVGEAAKNQATLNPENTVFDVKRLIGRQFDDDEVQRDMKLLPYTIVNQGGKPMIQIITKSDGEKLYAPEQISAMLLTHMKEIAETYLGQKIKKAVVTVPAYFNNAQRQATKDAGTIAGLEVLRILNEPTAAAMAYGIDKNQEDSTVLVYDLGGGTFDVSLLSVGGGVFEVLSTSGDTHLGGGDFDQRVMEHLLKVIQKKHNVDVRTDKRALQKVRRAAETAKRALSQQTQVWLKLGLTRCCVVLGESGNRRTCQWPRLLRDADTSAVRGAQHGSVPKDSDADSRCTETQERAQVRCEGNCDGWRLNSRGQSWRVSEAVL
eukprot:TRINITY_DN9051_c0_g1_i2.p1 TRINITY_DN9051_c0_g1~~TRINITY_DN9051_c0_g1_i2.p1  ORF type:complete len:391 (-),score=81.45 TRINITY_DN9051_c0_g1_i2:1121-2293(-)